MSRIDHYKPAPQNPTWEEDLAELTMLDRIRVGWERPAIKWLAALLAVVVALVLWNMKAGLANSGQSAEQLIETASGAEPPGSDRLGTTGVGSAAGMAGLNNQLANSTAGALATSPNVTVHVIGKVRSPGLVTLPTGSRVADAIAAAGGMKSGQPRINLARVLVDGEQVDPAQPDTSGTGSGVGGTAGTGAGAGAAGAGSSSGGKATGGKINLNTATSDQLQQLPRVGPATAQKILDYRAAHGAFRSIEQIQEIPGIGQKTFESLSPLISV